MADAGGEAQYAPEPAAAPMEAAVDEDDAEMAELAASPEVAAARGRLRDGLLASALQRRLAEDAVLKTSWLYGLTRKINTQPSLYLAAGGEDLRGEDCLAGRGGLVGAQEGRQAFERGGRFAPVEQGLDLGQRAVLPRRRRRHGAARERREKNGEDRPCQP